MSDLFQTMNPWSNPNPIQRVLPTIVIRIRLFLASADTLYPYVHLRDQTGIQKGQYTRVPKEAQ